MKTSIIILSYNTKDLLRDCLTSVYKNLHENEFEVIVVDNASKDESVQMLKKEFSKVNLIESKENLGFGNGINLGAKHAKGEYLFFLNSDTEIEGDILTQFIEDYKTFKNVGIVGSRLERNGSIETSHGSFYTVLNIFNVLFGAHFLNQNKAKSTKTQELDWVSGGSMFVKKNIFEEVGMFDKNLFMYMEDMELCYRVKQSGYKVLYDPEIVIKHVGQGSSNRTFAVVNIYKGILYFFKKHKSSLEYNIVRLMLKTKAEILFYFGKLYNKEYLVKTYGQALEIFR